MKSRGEIRKLREGFGVLSFGGGGGGGGKENKKEKGKEKKKGV